MQLILLLGFHLDHGEVVWILNVSRIHTGLMHWGYQLASSVFQLPWISATNVKQNFTGSTEIVLRLLSSNRYGCRYWYVWDSPLHVSSLTGLALNYHMDRKMHVEMLRLFEKNPLRLQKNVQYKVPANFVVIFWTHSIEFTRVWLMQNSQR